MEKIEEKKVVIGKINMQQFKSSNPTEKNFSIEQRKSNKTGKEFVFTVSLELDETNEDFLQRACLFVENQTDNLNTIALPIFPVIIITAINLPQEYRPNYVDTSMPLSGKLDNINYFYKASPQDWKDLLLTHKYFSDNWSKYYPTELIEKYNKINTAESTNQFLYENKDNDIIINNQTLNDRQTETNEISSLYIFNIKLDLQKTIDFVSENKSKATEDFFKLVKECQNNLESDKYSIEKFKNSTEIVLKAFKDISSKDATSIVLFKTFIGITFEWLNNWIDYLPTGYENICKSFEIQTKNINLDNNGQNAMFERFSETLNDSIFTINEIITQIKLLIKDYKLESEIMFNLNEIIINNKKNEANAVISKFKSAKISSSKGGCYIATMVYGDYDHPQVIILRNYRDNVLLKSNLGRIFVKIYYFISPTIVLILKKHYHINIFIKRCLDRIIFKINVRREN